MSWKKEWRLEVKAERITAKRLSSLDGCSWTKKSRGSPPKGLWVCDKKIAIVVESHHGLDKKWGDAISAEGGGKVGMANPGAGHAARVLAGGLRW